jgi:predicted dehydrogenase
LQHILQIEGIKFIGCASTHNGAAKAAVKRFDAVLYESVEELVNNPAVNLVYIATPPFLHYEHSMAALKAGKHVVCEKPLALTREHALEMVTEAKEKDLIMSVNLMQRYNPVYNQVKRLIGSKVMGEVLHAYFENYASDEFLAPGHWFWDKSKSGGIFIEHGVHFFDMFEGWFGKGRITSAQSVLRYDTQLEEQVQCQAVYNNGVSANFYHGFTQPSRMDRQELRILFEKGDVTLYEWVPYKVLINTLADEQSTKELMHIFPGAVLSVNEYYTDHHRKAAYRHKQGDFYQNITVRYGFDKVKMNVYGEIVKALFEDQVNFLKNRDHKRIITEDNGYNSLSYAVKAAELAEKHRKTQTKLKVIQT